MSTYKIFLKIHFECFANLAHYEEKKYSKRKRPKKKTWVMNNLEILWKKQLMSWFVVCVFISMSKICFPDTSTFIFRMLSLLSFLQSSDFRESANFHISLDAFGIPLSCDFSDFNQVTIIFLGPFDSMHPLGHFSIKTLVMLNCEYCIWGPEKWPPPTPNLKFSSNHFSCKTYLQKFAE